MAKLVKLDDTGFNNMIGHLVKGTGASLIDVTKTVTGSILENAARNTGKSNTKKIVADVNKSFERIFISSNGVKLRKGKDGSLIVKSSLITNNKWVWVRRKYSLNAITAKNKAEAHLSKKQVKWINKALAQLRKKRKNMLFAKKSNIGLGQATFLFMMLRLRIPVKGSRGLGAALKAFLSPAHMKSVRAKETKMGKDKYFINLKSGSFAALNPNSKGIDGFRKAFNSQVKGFNVAASKNLKTFTKKFATKNGFTVR